MTKETQATKGCDVDGQRQREVEAWLAMIKEAVSAVAQPPYNLTLKDVHAFIDNIQLP